MSEFIRGNIWDKANKKTKYVTVSLRDRTHEEAQELLKQKLEILKNENAKFVERKKEIAQDPRSAFEYEPLFTFIQKAYERDTGSTYILLGASKSGKSYLMMDIIKELYDIDHRFLSMIMAGNLTSRAYKENKKVVVFNGFKKDVIDGIKAINTELKNKYRWLVCVDDILDIRTCMHVKNLMLSYRNSDISTILSLQSATLVFKNVRGNAGLYCFTSMTSHEEMESIMDRFLKYFEPFKSCKKDERLCLYDQITENHTFIIWSPFYEKNKLFILDRKLRNDI